MYIGTSMLSSQFKSFLWNELLVGAVKSNQVDRIGTNITQSDTGALTMDAQTKRLNIQSIQTKRNDKIKDRPATGKVRTAYRLVVGKLLYIGHLGRPSIVDHASLAAPKWADLHLHHFPGLNPTLKVTKNYPATITYLPGATQACILEAKSDASMREEHE